jgi:hypothetical protein
MQRNSTESNDKSWFKPFLRGLCIVFMMVALSPLSSVFAAERLVDSSDYKDKDFIKGCIGDYSDIVKGDDLDWVWINPGTTLSHYKVVVGKFENMSDELRSSQVDEVKATYKEILSKLKGDGKDELTAQICIYDYQKFSAGKAWIPFVGGHQMQAGMGVEMILRDASGKTIAKIRDMARNGSTPVDAADESASNIKKFLSKH